MSNLLLSVGATEVEGQCPLEDRTRPGVTTLGQEATEHEAGISVSGIDGDHLTIDFDKAGRKKVMAAFVEKP